MKEIIEIVFVNENNIHNSKIALQLSEELNGYGEDEDFILKPLSSLNKAAKYVKAHPRVVGVISYYGSEEGIKSRGIDVIKKYNLFIHGVRRFNFSNGVKDIFKDFFIISSEHGFKSDFSPTKGKAQATLIVAERPKGKLNFLETITDLLQQNGISYSCADSKLRIKYNRYFYLEVNCRADELKSLDSSSVKTYKIKILGTYELPD